MKYGIILGLLIATTPALAKDCYVQRWSHSTSIHCDDGSRTTIIEDNTDATLPSTKRMKPIIGDDIFCEQIGSTLRCQER